MLAKDGVPRAGITTAPAGVPIGWLPYVAVDGCDATAARALKNGGSVPMGATDIPDIGRFAVLKDIAGAGIAVIKPVAK